MPEFGAVGFCQSELFVGGGGGDHAGAHGVAEFHGGEADAAGGT